MKEGRGEGEKGGARYVESFPMINILVAIMVSSATRRTRGTSLLRLFQPAPPRLRRRNWQRFASPRGRRRRPGGGKGGKGGGRRAEEEKRKGLSIYGLYVYGRMDLMDV